MIRRIRAASALVTALLVAGTLAACSASEPDTSSTTVGSVITENDVEYRDVDGESLMTDTCRPEDAGEPTAAVVMLHGGGFSEGSRSSGGMSDLCEALAEAGYAAFSIDYRLLPEFRFPAQTEDAAAAVEWLREPEQVEHFGIDPERIGILGSSAGAIVASWIGTAGEGPLTEGSRVKAVVAYSAVADMSSTGVELGSPTPEAAASVLAYLGCTEVGDAACPQGVEASPVTAVDATDAPQLLLTSTEELVPVEQGERMKDALEGAGVPVELRVDEGTHHGLQNNTPDNKRAVLAFLQEYL